MLATCEIRGTVPPKHFHCTDDLLVEPGPGSFEEKLDELRTFAVTKLTRLRELLASPSGVHEARALLAEQVGKMTLERTADGDQMTYRANGQIDFFGEELLTRVGGAGGPAWTERLPIHFGWLAAAP